jgi:L-ascorbate metabolism protein UlaG (beta-lactamase superfamily)
MHVTYFGHSCFLVNLGSTKLLFDPFISDNPLANAVDTESIRADYILVSHGHWDHTADLVKLAKQTGAKVISNFEIITWLSKHGIENGHAMNIGGHWMFDFGKVKCVNAIHSSTMPDGAFGGNPMGFLIETDNIHFYYAGDTALHYDMKLIGDFKKMNYAFLPMGNNFTMGIDNALIASEFIRCDRIIGMHYDTFDSIKIDHAEARRKFELNGKELYLMKIGETIEMK